MINFEKFAAAMSVLASAFGRTVDTAAINSYYRVLSPRLTTKRFERALQRVLEEESFWPSPAVILQHATSGDDAATALMRVSQELSAQHGYRFASGDWFRNLEEPVKAGISAIGGLRVITMATTREWPSLERRFVKAYNARAAELRAAKAAITSSGIATGRDRQLPREVERDMERDDERGGRP